MTMQMHLYRFFQVGDFESLWIEVDPQKSILVTKSTKKMCLNEPENWFMERLRESPVHCARESRKASERSNERSKIEDVPWDLVLVHFEAKCVVHVAFSHLQPTI